MPAPKKNMDPIMKDLETCGTSPNSVILSIGAVKFDPLTRSITDTFYAVINKQSCLDVGMTVAMDTMEWWSKQSPEAQRVLRQADGLEAFVAQTPDHQGEMLALPIQAVLEQFSKFAHWNSCVWGNGSDFDNAMVQEAYKKCGMKQPWAFWNNRCYRTMKNMIPDVPYERVGTYHNAVDDAATQAYHLMDILKKMRAA